MPNPTTADRFIVVYRPFGNVYQVRDQRDDSVRACYSFERFAISKAYQLNRDEVLP